MHVYVDCTSGEHHLVSLSNKIYENESDPRNKYIKHFKQCYRKGSVTSVCNRKVIRADKLLENITDCMKSLPPFNKDDYKEESAFLEVLEKALQGVCQNCARFDMEGYYQPAIAKPIEVAPVFKTIDEHKHSKLINVIKNRIEKNLELGKDFTSLHSVNDEGNGVRGIECYLSGSAIEAIRRAFEGTAQVWIEKGQHMLHHPRES